MLQNVQGHLVYVVDLKEMPKLPIIGDEQGTAMYAAILTDAILTKVITEPGKYGLEFISHTLAGGQGLYKYNVYKINEEKVP